MNAATAIEIAAKHAPRAEYIGSAELCLADARKNLERGEERAALARAAASLRYSVGVFHADYTAVANAHNAAFTA